MKEYVKAELEVISLEAVDTVKTSGPITYDQRLTTADLPVDVFDA